MDDCGHHWFRLLKVGITASIKSRGIPLVVEFFIQWSSFRLGGLACVAVLLNEGLSLAFFLRTKSNELQLLTSFDAFSVFFNAPSAWDFVVFLIACE